MVAVALAVRRRAPVATALLADVTRRVVVAPARRPTGVDVAVLRYAAVVTLADRLR